MTGPLGHAKAVKFRRYTIGQVLLYSVMLGILCGWSGILIIAWNLTSLSLNLKIYTLVTLGVNYSLCFQKAEYSVLIRH